MKVSIWRDSRDIMTLHIGRLIGQFASGRPQYRRLMTVCESDLLELIAEPYMHSDITNLRQDNVLECDIEFAVPAPY